LIKLRNEELLYKNYYFVQNNEDKTDVTRSTDEEMRMGKKKVLIGKGKEITYLGVLGTDGSKIYGYILQQRNVYVCVCVYTPN
jgi:hypothetical protein